MRSPEDALGVAAIRVVREGVVHCPLTPLGTHLDDRAVGRQEAEVAQTGAVRGEYERGATPGPHLYHHTQGTDRSVSDRDDC